MTNLQSRNSPSVRNSDLYRDVDHRHAYQPATYRMPRNAEEWILRQISDGKVKVKQVAHQGPQNAAQYINADAEAKRVYLVSIITRRMTTPEVIAAMTPEGAKAATFKSISTDTVSTILSKLDSHGRIKRLSKIGAQKAVWGPL